MSACKYCGAELIFIETPGGQKMPCEAMKVQVWRLSKGKKTAVTDRGETFRCETEPVAFVGSERAYLPHWASCDYQIRLK